jgi:hypothetical protein
VFYGVAGLCIQTMVANDEKGKRSEVLFPAITLERTMLEPMAYDRAHALSACVSCVALVAIASILALRNF